MKLEFTQREIENLIEQLSAVFECVTVQPLVQAAQLQPSAEGVNLEYILDRQPSACIVTRNIVVDGVQKALRMEGLLNSHSCAEHTMSAREQEIYHDDLIRDFLSGVYNRRYWDTMFCPQIAAHAAAGKSVAVALVSIDGFEALEEAHGALDTDQLICYVANQWKKFYDEGNDKIVCRLSKYTFAIASVGEEAADLEPQMRYLYEKMNLVCTSTCGMLCKIPFTLSIACASTGEVCHPFWAEMQVLCEARLHSVQCTGGNGVAWAELH